MSNTLFLFVKLEFMNNVIRNVFRNIYVRFWCKLYNIPAQLIVKIYSVERYSKRLVRRFVSVEMLVREINRRGKGLCRGQ